MAATITADTADQPGRRKSRKSSCSNAAKLRGGVMKRGRSWSYVIGVKDPETGASRPRWVGGFATEDEAKAARDEARVKARRGEYIGRNQITVTAYLEDWLDSHSMEIKPQDSAGLPGLYPALHHATDWPHADPDCAAIHDHQAVPRPSGQWGPPRQAAGRHDRDSPACDPAEGIPGCGHRRGFIGSNPVERAKRPRVPAAEPGTVWTVAQLQAFLATACQHRLFAFFHLAAYTGARRGELLNLRWPTSTST